MGGNHAHGEAVVLEAPLRAADVVALAEPRAYQPARTDRRPATERRRGWLIRRLLLAADVAGLLLAFALVQLLTGVVGGDAVPPRAELLVFLGALPAWIVLAKLHGLYDRDEERTDHSTVDEIVGVFQLVTICAWLVVVVAWLAEFGHPGHKKLLLAWALAIGLITLARASARAFCRRRPAYVQNTIIVGAGDVGQLIARKVLQHPEYGMELVGFVDAEPKRRRDDLGDLTLLGTTDDLESILERFDVERVIVAFSNESHELTLDVVRSLKNRDIQIDIVPRLFEVFGTRVGIHTIEGLPLIGLPALRLSRSSRLFKRAFDLVLTVFGVVLLAPAFALITLLIKLDSPGPVFFRQIRVGSGGNTFRIFKFRTMVPDADERKHEVAHLNMHAMNGGDPRMFKIPGDPRITRIGAVLRRFSLDELPQLLNVLKGEMSLVGPRPLILEEDRHVAEWARERLNLKPGLTGLWQVLGRNHIPFEEMTKLDYVYVTNWSLSEDIRLILRTIPALMRPSRAY